MNPYYDEDGITIYHGDCREIIPDLPPHLLGVIRMDGLIVTDPPYGIGWKPPASTKSRLNRAAAPPSIFGDERVIGDEQPFDPTPLLRFRCVLWGANHYSHLLPPGGWLVWDKTGGGRARSFLADGELAWHNLGVGVDVFHHLWLGAFRDSEIRQPRSHPTQKPVELMRWILEKWSQPDDLILDPYMGSGPVAQACYEMGRRYIGIEIEERYCEIAVQRLAQGVLAFDS